MLSEDRQLISVLRRRLAEDGPHTITFNKYVDSTLLTGCGVK